MIMDRLSQYQDLIQQTAAQFSIDPILVMALIWQESAGETWAYRYEKSFYDRQMFHNPAFFAEKLNISQETEKISQCISWGLLQIMGVVAREVGYDGKLAKLCVPERGLFWSCKKLKSLLEKYSDIQDVIASWNAGSPRKLDNGEYFNQLYVTSVVKHMEDIRKGELNG